MMQTKSSPLRLLSITLLSLGVLAGLLFGGRWAIEHTVRSYLLEHPEILPEAMANLEKKNSAQRLAGLRDKVEMPFPGAVLGNPQGKVTLVEFSDYACTYCRQSVAEVEALIKANPDLRVVIRELPILSPASGDAARMALAAATQGKFAAFHTAIFAVGRPDAAGIAEAARMAGLDMAKAEIALRDPRIQAELEANLDMAQKLNFSGTPSWVVGDSLHDGAVGQEVLAEAIAKARS